MTSEDVRAAAREYVDKEYEITAINVVQDPVVDGVWAVRVETLQHGDIDLLWSDGDFEEVEFYTWPPQARPK